MDEKTKQKIWILKKKDFGKILEIINPDQLEAKYGGTLKDINPFWPPIDPLKEVFYLITTGGERREGKSILILF